MKVLTAAASAKITADWQRQFPGLGKYRPLHLLRRVGPLLEGIVLERTSGKDIYRPTFHVHCLAGVFPAVTMTLAHELRSESSGGPDFVSVLHHESQHVEAAARLCRQSPLALKGNLTLEDVLDAYCRYLQRAGTHYDANFLYGDMARVCGWSGQVERANAIVAEGVRAMEQWPARIVDQMGGVEQWRREVSGVVANQCQLRDIADAQARLLGAHALPVADLVAT